MFLKQPSVLLTLVIFLLLGGRGSCDSVLRKDGRHSSPPISSFHQYHQLLDKPEPLQPSHDTTSCNITVLVDFTAPISVVDPEFLSVTLDADEIRYNFSSIDLTAPRIITMVQALAPAMLRIGGTEGDYLIFSETDNAVGSSNFTMTAAQWDAVNKFVQTVGWEFIFGLNALLRTPYPDGVWDSVNAAQLMSYSTSHNYTVNWELGNEPDHWQTVNITASQHAKDFTVLQELVTKDKPLGSSIVGPDVAGSEGYFTKFITSIEKGILTATTYHQYYGNGHTATLPDFYDVDLLDTFIGTAGFYQLKTSVVAPYADVWLGETSTMYDGGAPGISDTYVAGFMWLDKLGIAATVGHKRVFRQALVGGSYSLLDSNQNPLPDYWLSVLHKRLVGTKVLYVKGSLKYGRYLRAYSHCAKTPYPAGSVVLLLLNMEFSSVCVELQNAQLASSPREVYWLSPAAGQLNSTSVELNGRLLQLVANSQLPELSPEEQPASASLSLPPISFGFIVFNDAKIPACL